MTELSTLLSQLHELLGTTGAPVAEHLRPGTSADRVEAVMHGFGLDVDPDIVTWFSWHDGTDTPAAASPPGSLLASPLNHLLGGLHLPTLDQVATDLAAARELEPFPEQPLILGPGWFPFLEFTDGWLVCVDTRAAASPAPVYVWDTGAGYDLTTLQPWFPSVNELAATIVEAYQSGNIDPRELVLDFDRLPASARRLSY
ncbi:hypothetical protein GCM10009844_09290 [Nocardioides koreensis]|uniref:Knr4/Smi1-like domain-containing protein n=1 Tax=Nocardioides koreensis TaxID=433651 RepID=A0ABP5L0N0_9ACTN